MSPFIAVDADWVGVLNAAAVKVEEPKVLLSNNEGSNKLAVGLVDEDLPISKLQH